MATRRQGTLIASRWRVEARLGVGGTSSVYKATNIQTGQQGALKLFNEDLTKHPGILKILLAEARMVGQIDHPGTVKVLDEGVDESSSFLVFELLNGQSLEDLRQARGGRIPLDEVMMIGDAVMSALIAVHQSGIVHRDLKPQNIFVLVGGGIKLVDFGFAKLRGYTADAAQNVTGTPSFMSPEQAMGLTKKVDAKSDIWSLGATLFNILSGQSVHQATHLDAMMLASKQARPRSLAEVAPEIGSKIIAVVDRAVAYTKSDRWEDVPSMRAAWREAHPRWLDPLPEPKFSADPTFLDSDLLVPEPDSGSIEFDPRELVTEAKTKPKKPAKP